MTVWIVGIALEESKAAFRADDVMTEKLTVQYSTHHGSHHLTSDTFIFAIVQRQMCAIQQDYNSKTYASAPQESSCPPPNATSLDSHLLLLTKASLFVAWYKMHAQNALANPIEQRNCLDIYRTLLEYRLHSPRAPLKHCTYVVQWTKTMSIERHVLALTD